MAEKNAKPKKAPRRYRDARTGQFVTKKYAKQNRETTVKSCERQLDALLGRS